MTPFATMTASGRSVSLTAERLINLYPEQAPAGNKGQIVLRSTPGLSHFSTIGKGPIRALHVMNMSNAETLFAISGNDFYEVDSGGTGTLRGAAGTIAGTGDVSMASNHSDELVIVNSAGTGWVWDGTTLAAISGSDADFTDDATNVTFLDQYILYGKQNTGQVYASDLNNAKSWDSLSWATAEAVPDNLVEVFGFAGNLWLFGETTTEIWANSGAATFAFERIGGAVLEIGGVANSVAKVDASIYWLGSDGIVYKATGLQPQRISTHAIEFLIRDRTNPKAWAYKDEGHAFYVLGFDQGAVVFDAATGLWHERESFTVGRWRANSYGRVHGKHLVGDYLLGRIYEMDLENYSDGGNALQRRAISPPMYADGKQIVLSQGQVEFEHGVGLTSGQGSDPQIVLDWSDDGGKTWGNERWAAIGKIGEYRKRALWRRLGRFRSRSFRLTYSEPTKFTIYGANV